MRLYRDHAVDVISGARTVADAEFQRAAPIPYDFGITGNTLRTYRNTETSPSKVIRGWALEHGLSMINDNIPSNQVEAITLHRKLCESLDECWARAASRDLTVAEKYKAVDLFTKAVAFHGNHLCQHARAGLYWFANIPLDKFSLGAMRSLFYGIVIADPARMGLIKDTETYWFLQEQVFALTSQAKVPNLVFDHYAWNSAH